MNSDDEMTQETAEPTPNSTKVEITDEEALLYYQAWLDMA